MAKLKRVINLSEKREPMECRPPKKVSYPTLYIDKELPLSKTDIGKTFTVEAKIKCVGLDQHAEADKVRHNYRLEVRSIKF